MRVLLFSLVAAALLTASVTAAEQQVYFNDFNGPVGGSFPEWTSSAITYSSTKKPPGSGVLPAPSAVTTVSPNGAQKFLGEFGGPAIGLPGDPGYNHTRVHQTISLRLAGLPAHQFLELSFDLYLLKSWDGNSPNFGPDRFILGVEKGRTLLDTTFSTNPKIKTDGSEQNYPVPHSPPWTGAQSINTLGYSAFFHDAIYRLKYRFSHVDKDVIINFSSSLFEGKGVKDESWGLDNVRVIALSEAHGG